MKKIFDDLISATLIVAGSFYFLACAGETPDEGPIDSDQEELEAMAEDDVVEEE